MLFRSTAEICGLDGYRYKSSLDGKIYTQKGNLTINGEFDASFFGHRGNIEIADKTLNRIISVEKSGSDTTVVWNPAGDLAEMSAGQYKRFVCVELANRGDDFVTLKSGEKHRISMTVRVKNIK